MPRLDATEGDGRAGARWDVAEADELLMTIARHLELDWQYTEYVEAWDVDRIAEVRATGRKAGRMLGYKIMTRQSDPELRRDGRVVVSVAVREPPNAAEARRMAERAELLMSAMHERPLPPEENDR